MIKKEHIESFRLTVDSGVKYKINNLSDGSIEITFKSEEINWSDIKHKCDEFWSSLNYSCTYDDDFYSVHLKEAVSNLDIISNKGIPKIINKKKYIKVLVSSLLCFALLSIACSFILNEFLNSRLDLESIFMLSLNFMLIFSLIVVPIITIIYASKNYRSNLINLLLNSVLIDILLTVFIQHINNSQIYINDNFASTIINFSLMLIYVILLSFLLALASYIIRKSFLMKNSLLSRYNLLKSKVVKLEISRYENYCLSNKIQITDIILSKDGTNDIFGNWSLEFNFFDDDNLWSKFLLMGAVLFFIIYFFQILYGLTMVSRIILLIFIFFRTAVSTFNGLKKDKFVLINAIFHIEKILNSYRD